MTKKLKEIYHRFEGKLVGNSSMKLNVCKTVSTLPGIITFITQNCWFISSMEDSFAFALTGNELKDQHLIFLSDELLAQHEEQIQWSIAHEIGHVVLNHRNSILVKQSKEEIKQQEYEADQFAERFLKH